MTTKAVDGPLITGPLSVVPGVSYKVQVKVMMGDLDGGSGEYVDIGIDGKPFERCTPLLCESCAGSCEWHECSGISDLIARDYSITIRLQYGNGYNYDYSGPCQVNGTGNVYAAAIITLVPNGMLILGY